PARTVITQPSNLTWLHGYCCQQLEKQSDSVVMSSFLFMFQEDNGIPVHLKGGTADALLYRMTMSLSVLGVGYVLYELVKASFPQKKV
uniref:Cytochrome c oxidase subunit 7A2, mitochondrial n=1 Tax=Nothobranchius furzeri TaxID=105023 RepID=A0A8C6M1E0_NOTFU